MFFSVTFSFLYYDKIERSNQKEKNVSDLDFSEEEISSSFIFFTIKILDY